MSAGWLLATIYGILLRMRILIFSILLVACETKKVEPPPMAPPPASASLPTSLVLLPSLPELRLARVSPPRTLNPTYLADTEDERVANALFSPLVSCDPQTYEPKPGLLTKWESFDDNQRWRLTLREGLYFSNRETLNADDLVSTWLRLIDPGLPSRVSFLLDPVKNARSYHNGERLKAKGAISIGEVPFAADEPLLALVADVSEVTLKSSLYDKPNGKIVGELLPGDVVQLLDTKSAPDSAQTMVAVKTVASGITLSGGVLEGYIPKIALRPLYGPSLRAIAKLHQKTLSFAATDAPELDAIQPGEVVAPIPGEFAEQVGDKKMMMVRDVTGTFLGWVETSALEIKTYGAERVFVQSLDGARRAWVDAKSAGLDPSQVGIKKIDPLTVEVSFSQPTGYVPNLLCRIQLTPTPQTLIEAEGYSWTSPKTIASSGPFLFGESLPNGGVALVPNSLWYQKTLSLSRVSFSRFGKNFTEASDNAIAKYRIGELDALFLETWTINSAKHSEMFFRPDHTSSEAWQTLHLRVNTEVLRDVKIRQALVAAIDREQLRYALTPSAEMFHSMRVQPQLSPGFASYPEPAAPTYSPEEAKKLWKEAATRPTKLSVVSPDWAMSKYVLPALAAQWQDTLGVTVEITYLPWSDVNARNKLGNFDLLLVSWLGDFADPSTFTAMLSASSPENSAKWQNASFEEALRAAEVETDRKTRLEKLSKAEEILLQEAPLIPLFSESEYLWRSERLTGLHPNPLLLVDWGGLSLQQPSTP